MNTRQISRLFLLIGALLASQSAFSETLTTPQKIDTLSAATQDGTQKFMAIQESLPTLRTAIKKLEARLKKPQELTPKMRKIAKKEIKEFQLKIQEFEKMKSVYETRLAEYSSRRAIEVTQLATELQKKYTENPQSTESLKGLSAQVLTLIEREIKKQIPVNSGTTPLRTQVQRILIEQQIKNMDSEHLKKVLSIAIDSYTPSMLQNVLTKPIEWITSGLAEVGTDALRSTLTATVSRMNDQQINRLFSVQSITTALSTTIAAGATYSAKQILPTVHGKAEADLFHTFGLTTEGPVREKYTPDWFHAKMQLAVQLTQSAETALTREKTEPLKDRKKLLLTQAQHAQTLLKEMQKEFKELKGKTALKFEKYLKMVNLMDPENLKTTYHSNEIPKLEQDHQIRTRGLAALNLETQYKKINDSRILVFKEIQGQSSTALLIHHWKQGNTTELAKTSARTLASTATDYLPATPLDPLIESLKYTNTGKAVLDHVQETAHKRLLSGGSSSRLHPSYIPVIPGIPTVAKLLKESEALKTKQRSLFRWGRKAAEVEPKPLR